MRKAAKISEEPDEELILEISDISRGSDHDSLNNFRLGFHLGVALFRQGVARFRQPVAAVVHGAPVSLVFSG